MTAVALPSGIELTTDQAGSGATVVLIHGAWTDRYSWELVFDRLASRFHVVRYDRRGYGESSCPGTNPSGHARDLLGLIAALGLGEVSLVGNSVGACIAIHAALRAPNCVRLVLAHEPPIAALLRPEAATDAAAARSYECLNRALDAARAGHSAVAAQLYVDGMAAYSAWSHLPADVQRGFIRYADAFAADSARSDHEQFEPDDLKRLGSKLIVTQGARTSSCMKSMMQRLRRESPELSCHVFTKGGHVPQQSAPEEFAEWVSSIVREVTSLPRVMRP